MFKLSREKSICKCQIPKYDTTFIADFYKSSKEYQTELNKLGRLPRHKASDAESLFFEFGVKCLNNTFYGEYSCPVIDDTCLMKIDRKYHNNGAPLSREEQRPKDYYRGEGREISNIEAILRASNLDNKRSFSGTIQEHMRILEMEAFYLMHKLNVSSILIEFQPYEKDGDSTNPVELTLEPFGNKKRLDLIKRCFGRKLR